MKKIKITLLKIKLKLVLFLITKRLFHLELDLKDELIDNSFYIDKTNALYRLRRLTSKKLGEFP